jgi:hypothetical protein
MTDKFTNEIENMKKQLDDFRKRLKEDPRVQLAKQELVHDVDILVEMTQDDLYMIQLKISNFRLDKPSPYDKPQETKNASFSE